MSLLLEKHFIDALKKARRIVFFTGSGISAESGIPTFRGEEGLWNKFKPEELANFNAFIKNPALVTDWYNFRREIVRKALPNPGHLSIYEFEKFYDVTVVTQNVDNLHKRAGSSIVLELHGNIERNFCISCGKDAVEMPEKDKSGVFRCECGGLLRPGVVWFGENLPTAIFDAAEVAISKSDLVFVVGTSLQVYPAASLVQFAKGCNCYIVEINTENTPGSYLADQKFIGKSGAHLSAILEHVKRFRG